LLSGLRCDGRRISDDRVGYCPDGSAEPLSVKRGIVTKVEIDVAIERAIGVERGPAATAHLIALVRAMPRELDPWLAITIRVAVVKLSRHHDETQAAEAVLTEFDEAGLDQVDGRLIPVIHLRDTPTACDARTLGHALTLADQRVARLRI